MKHFALATLAALSLLVFAPATHAQLVNAVAVTACGTPPNSPVAGNPYPVYEDLTGKLCDTGTVQIVPGTTGGITPVPSAAAESCHVLKASAGNLYSVSGYVGAAAWIMVFNATTAPSDGAVTPVVWSYAPVAGAWSINYGTIPAAFSTGIVVCASSTGPLTKTAYSTNTVFSGNVQ